MKSMNLPEVRTFAEKIAPCLKGAQLQEILTNDQGLALGFFQHKLHWLLIEMVPNTPLILFLDDPIPFQKSAKSKPVSLFLNANAHGMKFRDLSLLEKFGRVLLIQLSAFRDGKEEICQIEIHLIPKHPNIIVRSQKKEISWEKPQELREQDLNSGDESAFDESLLEVRSLEKILSEWLQGRKQPAKNAQDPQAQWEKQRQKDIEKKTKAISEIQNRLNEDQSSTWYEFGEHLKTYGSSNLPVEWNKYFDAKKNLSWNIENAFGKAKQIEKKREGTLQRLAILEKEVADLQKAKFQTKVARPLLDDLMKKGDAKGRKLALANGMTVYMGKSAADNITLLRRAKAWDYWFHLKDYPGAHAIVHRTKTQELGPDEIKKVAHWVAEESLSSKSLDLGQKLAIVYVECRFVRPIKGDKLGRVTYHSEKQILVAF